MLPDKIGNNKHFAVLSYFLIILFLYYYTEKVTVPEYLMCSRLDSYIPFVKYMVIPYLFWYFYIAVALFYLGFNSKEDFYKLSTFIFVGMTVCFIIYLKFPNGHNLRPAIAETDLLSNMIRNIYIHDTPTNSAPSIHVLNSVGVHASIVNCGKLKDKKYIKMTSFIAMVSIIASTVMIKQHSVLDVIYGAGLSIVLYILVYKINIIQYINTKGFTCLINENEYRKRSI